MLVTKENYTIQAFEDGTYMATCKRSDGRVFHRYHTRVLSDDPVTVSGVYSNFNKWLDDHTKASENLNVAERNWLVNTFYPYSSYDLVIKRTHGTILLQDIDLLQVTLAGDQVLNIPVSSNVVNVINFKSLEYDKEYHLDQLVDLLY